MNITLKNLESARDALVARVKDIPNQVNQIQGKVQTAVTQIDLGDLKALPQKAVDKVRSIDLNIELPNSANANLKAFAPIDLPALQARTKDLQGKLVEIPALIQSFVQELPDNAVRIANDLPGTATKLVNDAKERTTALQGKLTFGKTSPKGKKTAKKAAPKKAAAKKPTAKKATATKTTAKKTSTKKATPAVPPVELDASVNGNGLTTGSLHTN
jgi:hypothetical protein